MLGEQIVERAERNAQEGPDTVMRRAVRAARNRVGVGASNDATAGGRRTAPRRTRWRAQR